MTSAAGRVWKMGVGMMGAVSLVPVAVCVTLARCLWKTGVGAVMCHWYLWLSVDLASMTHVEDGCQCVTVWYLSLFVWTQQQVSVCVW